MARKPWDDDEDDENEEEDEGPPAKEGNLLGGLSTGKMLLIGGAVVAVALLLRRRQQQQAAAAAAAAPRPQSNQLPPVPGQIPGIPPVQQPHQVPRAPVQNAPPPSPILNGDFADPFSGGGNNDWN